MNWKKLWHFEGILLSSSVWKMEGVGSSEMLEASFSTNTMISDLEDGTLRIPVNIVPSLFHSSHNLLPKCSPIPFFVFQSACSSRSFPTKILYESLSPPS
jgi:hypothetical protein